MSEIKKASDRCSESPNSADDFDKAFKTAKTIRKLGESNSTFPSWKNELDEIFNYYSLDDFEKKMIIKTTISDDYYDIYNSICFHNKDKDADFIIQEIKKQFDYSYTSFHNLIELEKIRVKKNDVKKYNTTFKTLLNDIEDSDKPPETILIYYYIRGLYGTRYYNTMVLKDFSTLQEAISEVDLMAEISNYKNKRDKNKRLDLDIQYNIKIKEEEDKIKKKKDTTLHDILKAIVMLKNTKEYNLFDVLNNTNTGITYAQLFAISHSLRKLCFNKLKLNNEDIRHIKTIRNFDIKSNEYSTVNDTIEEIEYAIKNNIIKLLNSPVPLEEPPNINIPTVIGYVDGKPSKVLLSSGSTVSIIKKSFYDKISSNHNMVHKNKTFSKFPCNTIVSLEYAVYLCLKFDKLKIKSLFWILKGDDPCYGLILGRNSLKENRLFIDPDDDGLYMKRNKKPPLCVAPSCHV